MDWKMVSSARVYLICFFRITKNRILSPDWQKRQTLHFCLWSTELLSATQPPPVGEALGRGAGFYPPSESSFPQTVGGGGGRAGRKGRHALFFSLLRILKWEETWGGLALNTANPREVTWWIDPVLLSHSQLRHRPLLIECLFEGNVPITCRVHLETPPGMSRKIFWSNTLADCVVFLTLLFILSGVTWHLYGRKRPGNIRDGHRGK